MAASGARLAASAAAQDRRAAVLPPPAVRLPGLAAFREAGAGSRRAAPFDSSIPPLPDGLANLDFDGWRDIRFKSDKPLLGQEGANFRLEVFHLGHLYKRPVVVNVLRDGIPAPIPLTPPICSTTGHTKSLAPCRSTSASPAFVCE